MRDITNMLDDASEEAIREIKRLRSEVLSLRAEVARLRLTKREILAILAGRFVLENCSTAQDTSDVSVIDSMIKRLGGVE